MRKINILSQKERRKKRVTSKISEKAKVPVLKVFRSNKHIYGQLIDLEKNI
ncbi:MAG: 50S ribosomal protein L18, partial [Brevinematales bacterium]